jgi:hypothetical protein
MMPARARIHRRDQLEFGRKFGLTGGSGDMNDTRFEWLAQSFQHLAVEFRLGFSNNPFSF